MLLAAVKNPVSIEPWEYLLVLVYMAVVGVLYSRRKNLEIKHAPEYRFYLWGIYAKILGSVFFSLIYVYYYGNGDTISYFISAVPLAKLMALDPVAYINALFAENNWVNYYHYFSQETKYPLNYVYSDSRTYILVKMISPIVVVTMHSYLLTGAVVSTIAFGGVWSLYRTLVRYYPTLQRQLALAILFFPSTLFWGSGIMKDTFTFTALCWYIHSMDNIFFLKKSTLKSWFIAVAAAVIMISMKPYVFMMIFPATLLWILYHRVARMKNALIRFMFLPLVLGGFAVVTITILNSLGDRLHKFSLERALETVVVGQQDLKRGEQYGENYFDLGEVEATWSSVLSKFPQATFAGLFRPSLLDVNNIVMAIAALENTWLLLFSLRILVRTRVYHLFTLVRTNPLLQMFFLFAVGYAFMVGVTTPNFGAMVRFKIPLLPLFVSGLFITSYILDRRREVLARGKRFDFELFSNGDPMPVARRAPNTGRTKARSTTGGALQVDRPAAAF